MKTSITLSMLLFSFGVTACQGPVQAAPSRMAAAGTYRFSYDPTSGASVDSDGKQGHNSLNVLSLFGTKPARAEDAVLSSRDATCVDFSSVNIQDYLHPTPGASWYASLKGWVLAGAVLRGNDLRFTRVTDADLRGADLTGATLGYSKINGSFDQFTKLDPVCTKSGQVLSCVK